MWSLKYYKTIIFFLLLILANNQTKAQKNLNGLGISFNGKFIYNQSKNKNYKSQSDNGVYACSYEIVDAFDEIRTIKNFQFFENGNFLYKIKTPPGSGVYISNSGNLVLIDNRNHFKAEITAHFYSKSGKKLFSESFIGASLFGFSKKGNKFGVGCSKGLCVVSFPDMKINIYESADQFCFSEDENYLAIASKNNVKVYSVGKVYKEFETEFLYSTRDIIISSEDNFVGVIDKKNLKVFSLSNKELLFSNELKGRYSYRDLIFNNKKIHTGIHYRDKGVSRGLIKSFDLSGKLLENKTKESVKQYKVFKPKNKLKKKLGSYDEIPWPFEPFDQVHEVWNYYEDLMANTSYTPYCHQGIDINVPVAEPIYAVQAGIVKCVLTLGGDHYWRIAISPTQDSLYSDGYLYAHLIDSTIQFDVGDTVEQHDYLGNIIHWYEDWGHVHFVQIRDQGIVWSYSDDQWGINFNPLLALNPNTDTISPVIQNVYSDSKFGLFRNNSDSRCLPDSVFGDVDIVVKTEDFINNSDWTQPAFETYYTIKKIPENTIVVSRTLGQKLNHSFETYSSSGPDYQNAARLIYKFNSSFPPLDWFTKNRNYYHNLTNNNGDEFLDINELDSAFSTASYEDGEYRIIVEAYDHYGNFDIDSMDIKIVNNPIIINNIDVKKNFHLLQNYPNPCYERTRIDYILPAGFQGIVTINIINSQGKIVKQFIDKPYQEGKNSIDLTNLDLPAGIYFYAINAGKYNAYRKMIILE